MQKGEEKHGRIISTRVPLPDYVNLLEEAQERGLKLSELLILKIFSKKNGNQIEPTRSNEHEVGSLDCPKVYNEFLQREVSEDLNEFIECEFDDYRNTSYYKGEAKARNASAQEINELETRIIEYTRELNSKATQIKELEKSKAPKTVSGLKTILRKFCDHTFKNRQENLEWRQDVMKFINELDDLDEE